MPVLVHKTGHTSHNTPEHQADHQPDLPAAVVGKKPSEHSRQYVEVVEHWPGYNLVEQPTAIPPPLTDGAVNGFIFSLVVERHIVRVHTEGLVEPAVRIKQQHE